MQIRIGVMCTVRASLLLFSTPAESEEPGGVVFEEKGNIFLKADGKAIQLTNTGRDSEPILSPDGRWVAFSRRIVGKPEHCHDVKKGRCAINKLWIMDLETKSERILIEPRKNAPDIKKVIGLFTRKTFFPDSKTVFFEIQTGGTSLETSGAIHTVDINGKNERFITYGSGLKIIKSAKEKKLIGHLIVEKYKHILEEVRPRLYWLVTPEGKELGTLGAKIEYFTWSLHVKYMKNGRSSLKERLEVEIIEKGDPFPWALKKNLKIHYGANQIDINADGLQDVILKTYWDNGNAHSFDRHMIALNNGGLFLEIPLGDDAKYSISTSEGASCSSTDISYLADYSFRLDEKGWLELTKFRRGAGEHYGDPQSVTVTTYKLVENPYPLPGFPLSFLKPVKKYVTREKYCDVRELMK